MADVARNGLNDACESVEAAEMLLERARNLDPSVGTDRLAAVWHAYDWHVDRATLILAELSGGRYSVCDRRVAHLVKFSLP